MRRVATVADLVERPQRAYFLAPSYCVWCWSDVLCGTILRAIPVDREVDELIALWSLVDQPGVGAVTDLRALSTVSASPFEQIQRYVASRRSNLAAIRHALLVDRTRGGAAAVGLMALSAPGWRAFETGAAAFAWASERDGADALPAIEQVIESTMREAPSVTRLRAAILRNPLSASLSSVAGELGMSERALQRELHANKTTFRRLRSECLSRKGKQELP